MTDPEDTPQDTSQDTELDSESSPDEAAADVTEEPWVESASAEYQTRLREFDEVESAPVTSMPVESSQPDE